MLLRRRVGHHAVVVTLAAACACGAPADPDGGAADARADGAPTDGRVRDTATDSDSASDGAPDSSRDSATDARLTDARADGAGPGCDPTWVELPDLPFGCRVERAERPECVFTPEWRECGDGCRYLAQDTAYDLRFTTHGGGGADLSVTFVRATPRVPDGRLVVAAVGTDARVHAAWRHPGRGCFLGALTYADGWTAFGVHEIDGAADLEFAAVYHGRLRDMKDEVSPVLVLTNDDLPGFGNALQHVSVSETTVVFQVQPIGEVWIIEGGALRRLAGIGSSVPGSPQRVTLVGRRALWNEWRQDVRIAHGTFDERAAPYFGVEGARVIFATDGSDLAWFQGYGWEGAGYTRRELWTASYVDDPAELRPRLVIPEFEGSSGGLVSAGAYIDYNNLGLTLVELDSGVTRLFPPLERGHFTTVPAWATATEVAILGLWDWRPTIFRLERRTAEPVE